MAQQTLNQRFLKELTNFRSPAFRRFAISTTCGIIYYSINGPFLHHFKEAKVYGFRKTIFGSYDKAGLVQDEPSITPELQTLIDETLKEAKFLNERNSKNISFSCGALMEPVSLGSCSTSKGFIILPEYFNIRDFSELKAYRMNRFLKEIHEWEVKNVSDWATHEGNLLIDSFLLSDKAKKFAIAREIYYCDRTELPIMSFYITMFAFIYFLAVDLINKRLKEKRISTYSRIGAILQLGSAFMIALMYVFFKAMMTKRDQGFADCLAVSNGLYIPPDLESKPERVLPHKLPKEYYEGGMEYYLKMKQRHIALRRLMLKYAGYFSYDYRAFSPEGQHRSSIITITRNPTEVMDKFKQYTQGIPQSYFEKNKFDKHIKRAANAKRKRIAEENKERLEKDDTKN